MKSKEKYIVDQIQNHRETVDTDDLWAGISGSIPQQEKKRRGFFWFWTGLLLLATTGLGYSYINTNEVDNVNHSTSNFATHQITAEQSNPIEEGNKANDIPQIGLEFAEEIKPRINNEKLSVTNEIENNIDNKLRVKQVIINSEINGQTRNLSPNENSNNEGIVNNIESPISQNERGIILQSLTELISEQGVINSSEERKIARQEFTFAALIPQGNSLFDIDRVKINIPSPESSMIDLVDERYLSPNRWSVFIESGASLVSRYLSTSDTEFKDAVDRRIDTEAVLGGWSMTVGMTYDFNSYLTISSGLSMDRIFEQSEFRTSFLKEKVEDGVTSIIHTQDGTITMLSEPVLLQSLRETSELRNNEIRFISIPLTLSVQLFENDHFSLGINGTLGYSVAQRYSGYISYCEDEASYDLEIDADNSFKRSGALFYGIGLVVNKPISKFWSLSTAINIRKSSNINSKSSPIEQSYLLNTVGVGITRKF